MRVVGIDTASGTASVALVENGLLVSEKADSRDEFVDSANRRNSKSNHAEIVLPLLELLFKNTGVLLQDITGLALSIGPGSFTGLRIGLSTVKGLGYGWQIPVVGVSTLLAHAARVTDYGGMICALLDARKNEVYGAVFQKTGDVVNRVTEDAVGSVENTIEMVRGFEKGAPCLIVGDGAEVYKHLLLGFPGIRLAETTKFPTIAATVARLSEGRFRSNRVDDLGTLTPLYIRPSEAEFRRQSLL
jgi:tRNA threonylcarbamoyladenosine biosynthesis protein TsaB